MNNCPAPATAVCSAPAAVPANNGWPVSHLHAAEHTFALLTDGDDPKLTLDAQTDLPAGLGLPAGRRSLAWWREWLLANRTNYDARNAIWAYVAGRAREEGGDWTIAAAGLAMPKLRRHVRDLLATYRGDEDDLGSDILTAFVHEIGRVDITTPMIDHRLTEAAKYRVHDDIDRHKEEPEPTPDADNAPSSKPPLAPYEHEDLMVAQAVKLGLLDFDDARAWVEVKLHYRPVDLVAAAIGVTPDCLRMRLDAAGTTLAEALKAGFLTGPMVISPDARKKLARLKAIRDQARTGRAGTLISTRMNTAMRAPVMAY